MIGFKTPLDMRKTGEQSYILLRDLVYQNETLRITVKKGFDFDGASIPRILWGVIGSPMTGNYTTAACLHDALYASCIFDRKTSDELFLEAMTADHVGCVLRYAIYNGVRIGGNSAYEDNDDMAKYRNLIRVEVFRG